jgi:hypothetical protein
MYNSLVKESYKEGKRSARKRKRRGFFFWLGKQRDVYWSSGAANTILSPSF